MVSKIGSVTALGLVVALYLVVPAVQAKTYKGTFVVTGESIDVFSEFSFDGSTTNSAVLSTGWGTDSLGDVGPGQSVSEYTIDVATPCTFKNILGIGESGVTLTLVASVGAGHASGGPLSGDTFSNGTMGTGCTNLSSGNFAITETDLLAGILSKNKKSTGTQTYTIVGATLSAPTAPGYGFFQWFKSTGKFTEKVVP
jgi:hypothetical protein